MLSRHQNEQSGFLSELEAIHFFERRGFGSHFSVRDQKLVDLEEMEDTPHSPDDCIVREVARFEGISDIDDMVVVYAIETQSGARGVLIDAFGPHSNPDVGAFLQSVTVEHGEVERDDLPAQIEQRRTE